MTITPLQLEILARLMMCLSGAVLGSIVTWAFMRRGRK